MPYQNILSCDAETEEEYHEKQRRWRKDKTHSRAMAGLSCSS
jgi:hypothetical protein